MVCYWGAMFGHGFWVTMAIGLVYAVIEGATRDWRKGQATLNYIYDLESDRLAAEHQLRWRRRFKRMWWTLTGRRGLSLEPIKAEDGSRWEQVQRTEGGRVIVERLLKD